MPKYGTRFDTMPIYPVPRKPKYLYCLDRDGFLWEIPNRHMVRKMKEDLKAAADKIRAAAPAVQATEAQVAQ